MSEYNDLTGYLIATDIPQQFTIWTNHKLVYSYVTFSVPNILSSAPASTYFTYDFYLTYTTNGLFAPPPYRTIRTASSAISITKDSSNHLHLDTDIDHSVAGPNLGGVVPTVSVLPTLQSYTYTINLSDPIMQFGYRSGIETYEPTEIVMTVYPRYDIPRVNIRFYSSEPSTANPLSTLSALAPFPASFLSMKWGEFALITPVAISLVLMLPIALIKLLR